MTRPKAESPERGGEPPQAAALHHGGLCLRDKALFRCYTGFMARSLLVGGPLSGQYLDMPDDTLTHRVLAPTGRMATYTVARIKRDDGDVEVWGWTPWCYRRVKTEYLRLEEP